MMLVLIQSKDGFFHFLNSTIKSMKKKHPSFKIVIGGDMIATISNDAFGKWKSLGPNNDDLSTNGNGRWLMTWCDNNNLFMMNSMFTAKAIHTVTWYMVNGFKKRIDYIGTEEYIKKRPSQYRVYHWASLPFESDHRMVVLFCKLPTKVDRKEQCSKCVWIAKQNSQLEETVQGKASCGPIHHYILRKSANTMNISDVNEIERSIVNALCKAAEETVSEKSVSKWTNKEFLFLIKEWIICKNPLRLKELKYEIKKMSRKLKNDFYGKKADVLYLTSEAKDAEQEFKLLNN